MTTATKTLRSHASHGSPEWLSVVDAARRVGIPRQKMQWLVRHGTIPHEVRASNHVGRMVRMVKASDVDAWAAKFPRLARMVRNANAMPASFLTLGAVLVGAAAEVWRVGVAPPPPAVWVPLDSIKARECDVVISLDDYLARANVLLLRRHVQPTNDPTKPGKDQPPPAIPKGPRIPFNKIMKC